MKLLTVEDNSVVQHVIRSLVASVAEKIRECVDGAEALATYDAERRNVVVADIELKTMEELPTSRNLREA